MNIENYLPEHSEAPAKCTQLCHLFSFWLFAWWVIPCQTTRKKLQRQKNVFFGLISVTYILNSQKMPFISVLLGLVLNFGQILSFSAFGMFFPYLSIFFGVNDQFWENVQKHLKWSISTTFWTISQNWEIKIT